MIYANKERAMQVAQELNSTPGYGFSRAARTRYGWTVRMCNGTQHADVLEWA